MSEHSFCRYLLSEQMKVVREKYTPEQVKKAWVYKTLGDYEFHGPNGEYFYGFHNADCKWSALAAGWAKLIDQQSEES